MTDQFEAGKCLHAASTDNLVLIGNGQKGRPPGNPWTIQMVQIPGPGLKVGAKTRGGGEFWRLELTDALECYFKIHTVVQEKEVNLEIFMIV